MEHVVDTGVLLRGLNKFENATQKEHSLGIEYLANLQMVFELGKRIEEPFVLRAERSEGCTFCRDGNETLLASGNGQVVTRGREGNQSFSDKSS